MKTTLLYLSIILISISCTNKKKASLNYFNLAETYFKKENYKKADSVCDLSILNDSTNIRAVILKSKIKANQSDFSGALNILKAKLKSGQSLDTMYYLLGNYNFSIALEKSKSVEKDKSTYEKEYWNLSKTYYDSALKYNSYYYKVYLEKSKVLHNLEDYENSMILLNKTIDIFPDSLELIYNRGVEKKFLGDNIGALKDLKKSIATGKLDSANVATAYRFMSFIYSDNKEFDTAISILTTALKFNVKDEMLFFIRGDLYLKLNKKDSACEDFRKAADLGVMVAYESIKENCK